MRDRAARVHDVRHIPFTLVLGGLDERTRQMTENAMRILKVEQQRSDRIAAHRSDAVRQHEPTGLGFDRRAAVADLQKLPRLLRSVELGDVVPLVYVARRRKMEVLAILAR